MLSGNLEICEAKGEVSITREIKFTPLEVKG
jgi:hypothetical protein